MSKEEYAMFLFLFWYFSFFLSAIHLKYDLNKILISFLFDTGKCIIIQQEPCKSGTSLKQNIGASVTENIEDFIYNCHLLLNKFIQKFILFWFKNKNLKVIRENRQR